jgi:signal transduction histidine kinase
MLDGNLFRQVVGNLLTNAFRFTLPEGTVSLHIRQQKNRLVMEIIDTGIGISEDEQHLIFNVFYRGNNVEGRRGLGLGLSIVSDALSRMNGIITVISRPSEGTIMHVEIPVAGFG